MTHKKMIDAPIALKEKIRELADRYSKQLKARVSARVGEMQSDDKSHYLIYGVLGITDEEGDLIDVYQNRGRFLYKYAVAFLEEAAFMCLKERFPRAKRAQVENTVGRRPRQFEIDCLIVKDALEIKWRDATTDGDHVTKEHTRIQAIKEHGYEPIRVMFYYPNRDQAQRIQAALRTIYKGIGGEYYAGDEAWDYVRRKTGVDLKAILTQIAETNKRREER